MRILHTSQTGTMARLLARDSARDVRIERQAGRIVRDVQRRGEGALRAWMKRLDGIDPPFEITPRELRAGWNATPRDVRRAIQIAARHIRRVAERQKPQAFGLTVAGGVRIEQRVQPLRRIGCYVPGGRFPLPSTLLMTVVPARVAGVPEIIVACPRPAPAVLAAALEAGASSVLRIGGAQAVAALAYGTASVPRVDKIVGPGNVWVATAKALVSADCAIDFRAGPSEIVVLSDSGRPTWIAADLLAQAEHDPDARAILVTTKRKLASAVAEAIREVTSRRGATVPNVMLVVAGSRRQAIDLVDRLAPEHLVCDEPHEVSEFRSAGTVFVGEWSAQAAGDYCTGSNHVLPTGGAARFRGGLSAADFVRVFTVQTLTSRGLRSLAPSVVALAEAEGLRAHADSIRVRLRGDSA